MAQKSGFFNALNISGEYDRKYNANDYSDNLAVVISNGVLRSTADDLKVTAAGMVLTVASGRAWINGHYYNNDTPFTFAAVTAPIAGNRYDRVILRLSTELNARNIELIYLQGTAATTPTKPAITRTTSVYDLVLADVYVTANATALNVTDTRDDATVCGWVYSTSGDNSFFTSLDASFNTWFQSARNTLSSVTLFKRYTKNVTTSAATTSVTLDIPQYDAQTCFIEVYVNGILDTRYTLTNNVITFAGTLTAGTKITINVYKSIDGTGIMTVADEITQLQNQYATLNGISKFTYNCTGLNDNIAISQIAQAIYNGSYTVGSLSAAAETFLTAIGGNTFLAAFPDDGQITIEVAGKLGATTPFYGAGTAAGRYRWFSLGPDAGSTRRVIFDFAKCEKINISCAANTHNIIFFGTDLRIKNVNAVALGNSAGTYITMIVALSNYGRVEVENSFLKIITTGTAIIAHTGKFTNCLLHVKSNGENGYIIDAKSEGFAQLVNCDVYAYTGTPSKTGTVFNISSGENNSVIMATNINAPVVAQAGYYQNYLCSTNAGYTQIYGVIGTLAATGTASYRSINGQIQKNKR